MGRPTRPVPDSVTFRTALAPDQHPGYPFSLAVALAYSLSDDGLTARTAIENIGTDTAPVAAGFHPYFTVGSDHIDADTLHLPFDSYLEYDGLLPTGRVLPVEGSPYDFRERPPHRRDRLQHLLCRPPARRRRPVPHPPRRAGRPGARALTVWLDESFGYVVLYSGDPLPDSHRRRALAIEPMTCGSDAFNHPDWGLVALAPGQTWNGSWGVTAG